MRSRHATGTQTAGLGVRRIRGPLGAMVLRAGPRGITHLQPEGAPKAPRTAAAPGVGAEHLDRAEALLARYFERRAVDLGAIPLDPPGTDFELRVWRELLRIPAGTTASYGEVARRLRRPGAARAVGLACRRNPVSILIPCHRVVGRDGALTGYAGGLWRKRFLLDLEAGVAAGRPAAVGPLPAIRRASLSVIHARGCPRPRPRTGSRPTC